MKSILSGIAFAAASCALGILFINASIAFLSTGTIAMLLAIGILAYAAAAVVILLYGAATILAGPSSLPRTYLPYSTPAAGRRANTISTITVITVVILAILYFYTH